MGGFRFFCSCALGRRGGLKHLVAKPAKSTPSAPAAIAGAQKVCKLREATVRSPAHELQQTSRGRLRSVRIIICGTGMPHRSNGVAFFEAWVTCWQVSWILQRESKEHHSGNRHCVNGYLPESTWTRLMATRFRGEKASTHGRHEMFTYTSITASPGSRRPDT